MARPLTNADRRDEVTEDVNQESWLTRSTARAFAAAISSLLIATLVVNQSSEALTSEGTVAGSAVTSGTISLIDDDAGRSLFDLSDMAPGRPVVRCIEVVYDGTIVPVDLALKAETSGTLAEFLDVSIDEGTGGGFDTCDGFSATDEIYDGTLAGLAAADWLELERIVNTGSRRSYRITFDLQDEQDALGQAASASFVWEVTPS